MTYSDMLTSIEMIDVTGCDFIPPKMMRLTSILYLYFRYQSMILSYRELLINTYYSYLSLQTRSVFASYILQSTIPQWFVAKFVETNILFANYCKNSTAH